MTDMDLCKPRAYRTRLFYGEKPVGSEQVVVLDFSAGRPAEKSRDLLRVMMVRLAEVEYIRPGDYEHCWLELSDSSTGERLIVWRSYD